MKNLEKIFKNYGILLSEEQKTQFDAYFSALIETNKQLNLTAITEEDEVVVKHFLDSVLPKDFFTQNSSVVDIGSGAGFPAIPLKILRPDLHIYMVDSLNKRVNFLNQVVLQLKFEKAYAIHSRAEDFARKNREKYDFTVARAVAPLNTLVEYLLPLVKIGGYAVVYKSAKLDEELKNAEKAINILGGKIEKIEEYSIVEGDLQRKILFIKKISVTQKKYPRDKNKPRLSPIS